MMTQLNDILAALCLPALLATALLARALRRSREGAARREGDLRRDAEELRAARAELERTSYTDPLTGVWNYRYLQLSLDREIARCLRNPHRPGAGSGGQFALLLLEIDGFDEIRRTHGHQRGGAVLRDLAQRLAMEFRQADIFGRYGGEEFLVLLPDTDADGAEHAAERLRWTVRRHALPLPAVPATALVPATAPVPAASAPAPATASAATGPGAAAAGAAHPGNGLRATVGVASLPRDGAHAVLLLRAADRALAQARGDARTAALSDARPPAPDGPAADGETPTSHPVHSSLRNAYELPLKTQGPV